MGGLVLSSLIWDWHKYGLELLYTSVVKGLNLKVRKFWGLTPTFIEVPEEKLVGRGAFPLPTPPPPILNRVNENSSIVIEEIMNTLNDKNNELTAALLN